MKPKPLGCLTPFALLTSFLFIASVLAIWAIGGGGLFSPGALNAHSGSILNGIQSHQDLSTQCAACHTPPLSAKTMAQSCLDCHADIQGQLSQPDSLHGILQKDNPGMDCRACHTEHIGKDSDITRFDITAFPHTNTGFVLDAHTKTYAGGIFQCHDCHTQKITTFESATCLDCHSQKDPPAMQAHITAFGTACIPCHDGVDRFSLFDHNKAAFQLTGSHSRQPCSACHLLDKTIPALQSRPQDCTSCHAKDDTHQGRLGPACADCHSTQAWKPATFDHNKTAFALTGKHQNTDCMACHKAQTFKDTPTACGDCHAGDDTHQGQLGSDCAACHTSSGWKPATFDHNQIAFPLTGKHATTACQDCHRDNQFKSTSTLCADCHARDDNHQGRFGTDCGLCHSTSAWKPATFDHGKSAFPLTGKHTSVECQACHKNSQYAGTPSQCANCHADPAFHAGLFTSDCSACHTSAGWVPAQFNSAHTFPINHGDANTCRSCHPTSLKAYTCFSCHDQASMASKHSHEGISDITNCTRCHANGRGEGGGGDGGGGGDD